MTPKPFWKSRKFIVMAIDAVAALLALYMVRLLPPEEAALVIQTWAIIQPVMLAVILGIAYEDGKALQAGTHPSQSGE